MRIRVQERTGPAPGDALTRPALRDADSVTAPVKTAGAGRFARIALRLAAEWRAMVRGLALFGSPLVLFALLALVVPAFAEMAAGGFVPALSEHVFTAGAWAASPLGVLAFVALLALLVRWRSRPWLPTLVLLVCVAAVAVVVLALLLPFEPMQGPL